MPESGLLHPPNPNPRNDPPIQEDTKRSILIGLGVELILFMTSLLVGGSFFPFLVGWVGMALVFYGIKPGWFAHHIDAQIIQQTPYRRKESIPKWSIALVLCLILAGASSRVYRRYKPEKPNILTAIYQGILDIKRDQAGQKPQANATVPDQRPHTSTAHAPSPTKNILPVSPSIASSATPQQVIAWGKTMMAKIRDMQGSFDEKSEKLYEQLQEARSDQEAKQEIDSINASSWALRVDTTRAYWQCCVDDTILYRNALLQRLPGGWRNETMSGIYEAMRNKGTTIANNGPSLIARILGDLELLTNSVGRPLGHLSDRELELPPSTSPGK